MQSKATQTKKPSKLLFTGIVIASCCFMLIIVSAFGKIFGGKNPATTVIDASPTIALPSNTLAPTNIPAATNTLAPTNTPLPTATNTPLPEPITLSGSGDDVVDIQKWNGPAIIQVTHNGNGNFTLWNDDAVGNHIDLLINTIGPYKGTLPLDFLSKQSTARLEITADGAWEIKVLPLEMVRRVDIPGAIQGAGDEVIAFHSTGGSPDLLKADASQAHGNFAVWAYGNRRNLAFNEIAPYSGTVSIHSDVFILVIKAEGPWSIEVTTR